MWSETRLLRMIVVDSIGLQMCQMKVGQGNDGVCDSAFRCFCWYAKGKICFPRWIGWLDRQWSNVPCEFGRFESPHHRPTSPLRNPLMAGTPRWKWRPKLSHHWENQAKKIDGVSCFLLILASCISKLQKFTPADLKQYWPNQSLFYAFQLFNRFVTTGDQLILTKPICFLNELGSDKNTNIWIVLFSKLMERRFIIVLRSVEHN